MAAGVAAMILLGGREQKAQGIDGSCYGRTVTQMRLARGELEMSMIGYLVVNGLSHKYGILGGRFAYFALAKE